MPLHDRPEALLLRALEEDHAPQAAREAWLRTARPNQITPPGDWQVWLILAGRGWGKTRTGAEDAAWFGLQHPGARIALVGPTYADARDVMVEGDSGLRSVIDRRFVDTWNRSLGEFVLTNGSRFKLFSAEEPERLRGPQHHRAWCDELAAWKYLQATWDQLAFGLRLGAHPQIVVTTTPKPRPLIRQLRDAPTTVVTVGSTFDNRANLAPSAVAQLESKYAGTRLGRQELQAEILEDTPGALWTRAMLESAYIEAAPSQFTRVVVAVDPSGSSGESGDAQGIVVCGLGMDGRGYVIEDATMRGSPDQWARQVAYLHDKHRADRVVAEKNYGGAMVEAVLRTAAPNLPVKLVSATRGKYVRAEPVAALYEQGRISHIGAFPELEDEMTLMTGGGFVGSGSPNRVDALVWAFTELMLEETGQGWIEWIKEEVAAALGRPPEPLPDQPLPVYSAADMTLPGAVRPPNTPPVFTPSAAPRVLLRAPPLADSFQLMPSGVRYTPGPDRLFEADAAHVEQLKQSGCSPVEGAQ